MPEISDILSRDLRYWETSAGVGFRPWGVALSVPVQTWVRQRDDSTLRHRAPFRAATIACDVVAAAIALVVGVVFATPTAPFGVVALVVLTAAWAPLLASRRARLPLGAALHSHLRVLVRSIVDLVAVFALLSVLMQIPTPKPATAAVIVAMPAVSMAGRALIAWRLRTRWRAGLDVTRVLAVGSGRGITALVDELASDVSHEMVVVGACLEGDDHIVEDIPVIERLPKFADSDTPDGSTDVAVKAVLAAIDQVDADVVCATNCSEFNGLHLRALTWPLADRGVDIVASPGFVDIAPHRLTVRTAGALGLIHIRPVLRRGVPALIKRGLDHLLAALALVLLSPLLLAIALAIALASPGPALFRQRRLGFNGREFTMWKFRTMVINAEHERDKLANDQDGLMFKVREDPRVTRLGRFLRRYSLDELPQLINVLLGQMSLVGPRPPLPDEALGYGYVEFRRLKVRPGMTGLWQVSGRSNLTWDETLRMDLRYVDNWSVGLDVSLLARTLRAVVRGDGAY